MTRQELTETIYKEGEAAGYEVVGIGGEKKNPIFWRNKAGEVELVFNLQGQDIAIKSDKGHIEAVLKRFKGFPEAKRRVLVLFTQEYDGAPKTDGVKAATEWVANNVKGSANRVEVWSEMHRVS